MLEDVLKRVKIYESTMIDCNFFVAYQGYLFIYFFYENNRRELNT